MATLIIPLPLTLNAAGNCGNSYSEDDSGSCLENPLGSETIDLPTLYGRLLFYGVLFVTGGVALIMFVIGGFMWMTAAGNPEKIKKGKDTLMWAILGIILIFSSYSILRAIFEILQF